jgi:hypothetical protein
VKEMEITKDQLIEILKYVETIEAAGDSEWSCRTAKELINEGALPEWYYSIRAKLFVDEDTINMDAISER